jgi:hypothetical protein
MMAIPKLKPSDQGLVILIVAHGASRSRRIIIPHETVCWLVDELQATLAYCDQLTKGGR